MDEDSPSGIGDHTIEWSNGERVLVGVENDEQAKIAVIELLCSYSFKPSPHFPRISRLWPKFIKIEIKEINELLMEEDDWLKVSSKRDQVILDEQKTLIR